MDSQVAIHSGGLGSGTERDDRYVDSNLTLYASFLNRHQDVTASADTCHTCGQTLRSMIPGLDEGHDGLMQPCNAHEEFYDSMAGSGWQNQHQQAYMNAPSIASNGLVDLIVPFLANVRVFLCYTCRSFFDIAEDFNEHEGSCKPVASPKRRSPTLRQKSAVFCCPVDGCNRAHGGGRPFPRKDNANTHIRSVHKQHNREGVEPVKVDV